jgi:hypothetical protein
MATGFKVLKEAQVFFSTSSTTNAVQCDTTSQHQVDEVISTNYGTDNLYYRY